MINPYRNLLKGFFPCDVVLFVDPGEKGKLGSLNGSKHVFSPMRCSYRTYIQYAQFIGNNDKSKHTHNCWNMQCTDACSAKKVISVQVS